MNKYHLSIVTPDGIEFDGEAESLLIRTTDGDVEILAGHMDYMASIGTGRARIITGGVSRFAACSGGFLTVAKGDVKLIAITFEFAEDIDLERARRAKERAEEQLAAAKDDKAITLAKARLQRAISRIDVKEI